MQVAESGDDVWASIALPVVMSSAEGQQVGGGGVAHADACLHKNACG